MMRTVRLIKLKAKRDALEYARKIINSVLRNEIDATSQRIKQEEIQMKRDSQGDINSNISAQIQKKL